MRIAGIVLRVFWLGACVACVAPRSFQVNLPKTAVYEDALEVKITGLVYSGPGRVRGVSGLAHNQSDSDLVGISIDLVLSDKQGVQFGQAMAFGSNLRAGKKWDFEAIMMVSGHRSRFSEPLNIEVGDISFRKKRN